MEALPADEPLADFWPSSADPLYASKHNPFALFTDICSNRDRVANIKPYTDLAGDLNSRHAPRFVFITPDQCNDMLRTMRTRGSCPNSSSPATTPRSAP
jgi:phosphatidylinositol-3-phosphatase